MVGKSLLQVSLLADGGILSLASLIRFWKKQIFLCARFERVIDGTHMVTCIQGHPRRGCLPTTP